MRAATKPFQSTEQWHLYGTYVSDVTGDLHTYSYNLLANTDGFTSTFIATVKMKLEALEVGLQASHVPYKQW